jgi:alkylation response protein AidB-like acyl-CoA dehydrogenase
MNFAFTSEQDDLRRRVRGVVVEEKARGWGCDCRGGTGLLGSSPSFSRTLASFNWIGLAWPKEYGGQEMSYVDRMILMEEMSREDAPLGYHLVGERQVGPSIMRHGTLEQKEYFLPRILGAQASFCSALSEANAGSDLAALETRAERNGDHYVIHGVKLWCSVASTADFCWTAVRTNRETTKHKGITTLIVDMHSSGLHIRPLLNMAGHGEFFEIVFDGVQVPITNRVGNEDQGWYILAEHLDFERAGIERLTQGELLFRETIELAKSGPAGAFLHVLRHRLAELAIEFEVGRLLCYHVAWLLDHGCVPSREASQAKTFGTEWIQRVAEMSLSAAELCGADRMVRERLCGRYLNASSLTIAGGTSEVQRNIIALRGLDLPRD